MQVRYRKFHRVSLSLYSRYRYNSVRPRLFPESHSRSTDLPNTMQSEEEKKKKRAHSTAVEHLEASH